MGLYQWVLEGTFHPSGNILDLVFTSESDVVGNVFVLPPLPGCHHSPVVVEYFADAVVPSEEICSESKLWHKGNYRAINNFLLSVDWMFEFEGGSAEDNYGLFLETLNNLIECYVPSREVKMETPAWMSSPPRSLMRDRSSAWRLYKQLRRNQVSVTPSTVILLFTIKL